MGEGVLPLCSYVFFPSSEKWLTLIIACIGEYTQAEAYLQEGLDLHSRVAYPRARMVLESSTLRLSARFSESTWGLRRGCRCNPTVAVDFLLVAGDSYGGTAAFLDGVTVEGVGAPMKIVVATTLLRVCCTFVTSTGSGGNRQ